jgi:ABC-type phosphate transport system substrate-binding protein
MDQAMRLFKYLLAGTLVLGLSPMTATADVVVVVSSKSQVVTLSKNQVTDIFLGKSARFPDGSPAIPIDQAEGAAVREEFYNSFAAKSAAQMKAYWSKIIFTGRGQPPKAVLDSDAAKRILAQNPNAIGYLERNLVDSSVKILAQP